MATEAPLLGEEREEREEREEALDEDERPTVPAIYTLLSFDTASEAFFVRGLEEPAPAQATDDEEDDVREYWARERRRRYGRWVALVFAGSLTLLAASWLPLLGG